MLRRIAVTLVLLTLSCYFISCSTATTILFKIEPSSHNFGQVNIGVTATFDFVITNKKSVNITLTTVSFTTGEFSEITNAQGKTIAAKGTLTITVRFAPALPGGAKTDKMHIEWTDINGKTGKKDLKLDGEAVPVPKIIAPTTYDFGTVGIGQTGTHNFNIENTGTSNLTLSLFNFNGNATLFSITAGGATPITVTPSAIHTVTVQFTPTATGSFPTILEISHNGINVTSPAQINIAAAGGGGRIVLNKTSPWDFGQVKTGNSMTDVLEVSNTGSINLNITGITLVTGTFFTIDSLKNSSGNPITVPFAIAPSAHVNVTIKFTPIATTTYNDTLNIANDGSYAASPATLNLTGTGRAPITQTFNYTGSAQNWNIPAGVAQIAVDAYGAESGNSYPSGHISGKGGRVQATLTVTPGGTLGVYVGGKGVDASSGVGGAAGWNGGGLGGGAFGSYGGGGGGGASDLRSGGNAYANRIISAGAGGGAGFDYGSGDNGGNGGGLTGQDGSMGGTIGGYKAGKGGTQTAGGAAGGPYSGYGSGSPGVLGEGGAGGTAGASGAGGGGYYGGGGGIWAGAGGGSSWTATGATNVIHTQGGRSGNGQIAITY